MTPTKYFTFCQALNPSQLPIDMFLPTALAGFLIAFSTATPLARNLVGSLLLNRADNDDIVYMCQGHPGGNLVWNDGGCGGPCTAFKIPSRCSGPADGLFVAPGTNCVDTGNIAYRVCSGLDLPGSGACKWSSELATTMDREGRKVADAPGTEEILFCVGSGTL